MVRKDNNVGKERHLWEVNSHACLSSPSLTYLLHFLLLHAPLRPHSTVQYAPPLFPHV